MDLVGDMGQQLPDHVRCSSQAPVYLPTMDEHLLFEGEGIALF